MKLYELLILEICACNDNSLKRYFMRILDRAVTIEFGEFIKVRYATVKANI